MIRTLTVAVAALFLAPLACAQEAVIRYLANEGVMFSDGSTSVLFDPLYNSGFDRYQMVPDDVRAAIFAGEAPFDTVSAVFVSHHHGDHFSAEDILRLMRARDTVTLYAPMQAVSAVRDIASPDDQSVLDRMVGLDLDYGDVPVTIDADGITIEAVHVPHSGWPTARTDVQNIAFRVTLGDGSTVLHMGDADARVVHYEADAVYWEERTVDVALPPYWYFLSDDGIEVLEDRMNVIKAIGIHVPDEYSNPANLPEELLIYELFTAPGEGRRF
jgi:L-ascorbate metabolism protein UlaG (beta-lactamase superfamily)